MRHLTLLALLALAPGLTAQVTEAQAVQQARAASKAALATLKIEVAAARHQCLADIEAFEAQFKLGQGLLDDVDELFASLESLQQTVQAKVQAAVQAAGVAAGDALVALGNGTSLEGKYPSQLQIGTGGVIDDTDAAVDRLLGKTYRALDKRLDKTEALVASTGNVRLRVSIRPPGGSLPLAVSDGALLIPAADIDIDLLCAACDTVVSKSGTILASGSDATVFFGPGLNFEVEHAAFYSVVGASKLAEGQDQRWTAEISGLDRGSYTCTISPADGIVYRAWAFGIP